MEQWFLLRNQQTYGPYSAGQLAEMARTGYLLADDYFAIAGTSVWLSYQEASAQWLDQSTPATPSPGRKRPKGQRHGCLRGCLVSLLVLVLILGALAGGYWLLTRRDSRMMTLARSQPVLTEVIPASGGTIQIDASQSAIDGMKIEIPAEAYKNQTKFKISTSAITDQSFGDNFVPITPLIRIENGGERASVPLRLTIPIQLTEDEFAMGYYYDRQSGRLEGMALLDLDQNQIVVGATHFSELLIVKVEKGQLDDLKIVTGYKPGRDDWQFENRGSILAYGGQCAGQAITSIWYYEEIGLATGRRLFGRFDNNGRPDRTPKLQEDDSNGYRFASVIQHESNFDKVKGFVFSGTTVGTSTWKDFYSIAEQLQTTNRPVLVGLNGLDQNGQATAHTVVAYRIEANLIYVADPNFPGDVTRCIVYNPATMQFDGYFSARNRQLFNTGDTANYTVFRYIPVSDVIADATIKEEYQYMLSGEIGTFEGEFPDQCEYEWLSAVDPKTGEEKWEKCPDEITLDIAKTAAIKPELAGKIKLRITTCSTNQLTDVYNGTNRKYYQVPANAKGITEISPLTLEKGVNDLGFCIQYDIAASGATPASVEYANFKRIKVLFESVDLSGTWKMEATAEAGSLLKLAREIVAQLLYALKLTDSLDQARAEAVKSVSVEPGDFSASEAVWTIARADQKDPDNYRVTVRYVEDGKPQTVSCQTRLNKDGSLRMQFWDPQGQAAVVFKGGILNNDTLGGDFDLSLFRFIRGSLEGQWKLIRQP